MKGVPLPPYDEVQLLEMTLIARCVAGAHVGCLVASEEGIQDILAKQQQAPHLWRPAVNVWSPELIEQVGELGQEWMKELAATPGVGGDTVEELTLFTSYTRLYTERLIRALDLCRRPPGPQVNLARICLFVGSIRSQERLFEYLREGDEHEFLLELQETVRAFDEELRILQRCMQWDRAAQLQWHRRTLEQLPPSLTLAPGVGDDETVTEDIKVCTELIQQISNTRRLKRNAPSPTESKPQKQKRKKPKERKNVKKKPKQQHKNKSKKKRTEPEVSVDLTGSAEPDTSDKLALMQELKQCEREALATLEFLSPRNGVLSQELNGFIIPNVAPPGTKVNVKRLLSDTGEFRAALGSVPPPGVRDSIMLGKLASLWDLARRALNTHALMEHLRAQKKTSRPLPARWDAMVSDRGMKEKEYMHRQASRYDALGAFFREFHGFLYCPIWTTLAAWVEDTFSITAGGQAVNRVRALRDLMTPFQRRLWADKQSLSSLREGRDDETDQSFMWQVEEVPGDGDCAFHCLDIARNTAARELLSHSEDEEFRRMIGNEVWSMLYDVVDTSWLTDAEIDSYLGDSNDDAVQLWCRRREVYEAFVRGSDTSRPNATTATSRSIWSCP